ncbi:MAG: hypothetical protein ABI479_01870 [Gallionella sp.]
MSKENGLKWHGADWRISRLHDQAVHFIMLQLLRSDNKVWSEISQFDIPSRQLLPDNEEKRADRYTHIGKAQVISTFFGVAKVRVIREQHKPSYILPLAALALTGIAAAIWQEQDIPQQRVPMRVIVRPVIQPGTEQTNPPTSPTEPIISRPVALPMATKVPQTPSLPKDNSPPLNLKKSQQLPLVSETPAPMGVKPAGTQSGSPQMKNEPVKIAPAPKPLPLSVKEEHPKNPATINPSAKMSAEIQSASQPIAGQPAVPIMKKEKPVAIPVVEPSIENTPANLAPATADTPPGQTSTQP